MEWSGGGWGWRWLGVGGEGEGRLYHDTPPLTIYILHTDEDALISRDTPVPSNVAHFIMDSGASAHMCPDCSYFSSYQKIDPLRHIWVADNCTIEVISVGDIKV